MEKTLSKKQKTVYSVAAILVFLVLVYLGDKFIPMTSQWNMQERLHLCAGCGIDELTERLHRTFFARAGRLHAYRRVCLCNLFNSRGAA